MSVYVEKLSARRVNYTEKIRAMNDEWESLCARYLPCAAADSIWKFNREVSDDDPKQGWKIHVSATVLSAGKVLRKVAPLLCDTGVLFKAPLSLLELRKINCGLFYGFSQVGKFITVYPRSPDEAVWLARKLHRLTYRFPAPSVPYDLAFRRKSCVYYRYGSFTSMETEFPDGSRAPAIRNAAGELVPDLRGPNSAVPNWVTNPFIPHRRAATCAPVVESPLGTTIFAYQALSQRGKGGVYRALDTSVTPARLCILKEGRRHGETSWDGRDGYWRVRHEARMLAALSAEGIAVPEIYRTFESNSHYYLVTEFIEGHNLQSVLDASRNGIPVSQALRCGIEIALLMSRIHSAGLIWRDCKPANLILDAEGSLRPLDFEGACLVNAPDAVPWVTLGYGIETPLGEERGISRLPEDLYALGVTLHRLFSAYSQDISSPPRSAALPPCVPRVVREIISALTCQVSKTRPTARAVLSTLEQAYAEYVVADTSRQTTYCGFDALER